MIKRRRTEKKITLQASPSTVWKALTDPDLVRRYLDADYTDAGNIVNMIPEKLLHTVHPGFPEDPAKPRQVVYELRAIKGHTTLVVSEEYTGDEAGLQKIERYWEQVLTGIRRLVENPS